MTRLGHCNKFEFVLTLTGNSYISSYEIKTAGQLLLSFIAPLMYVYVFFCKFIKNILST